MCLYMLSGKWEPEIEGKETSFLLVKKIDKENFDIILIMYLHIIISYMYILHRQVYYDNLLYDNIIDLYLLCHFKQCA